ncbi:hypothetical protein DYBT9275_01337 [Dyadobacter sp. CECT 9275]|uniref:Uncharacterized protein n=1 Tax=Dyadobacter helix TaxID=2822344 RepID=A0A916JBV7_9BACT|nr:hypothetical protein [Dyadobacter sp. CECT 9275]CAG4994177.1 hypothetical protein DYBT9275_01337 [Dyadobacter sp. CECT 9275]
MNDKFLRIIILFILSGLLPTKAQPLKWLIPDFATVQYAGSIGWLSVGTGYDILKDRARLSVQYGYVPEPKGGPLHILSGSFVYEPFIIKPSTKMNINVLDTGIRFSYQFGEDFHFRWPGRYPEGYYWWKTALRAHLITETSITWKSPESNFIKATTGYIELNSNDLYLVSYFLNTKSLSPSDIIKIGAGIRFKL